MYYQSRIKCLFFTRKIELKRACGVPKTQTLMVCHPPNQLSNYGTSLLESVILIKCFKLFAKKCRCSPSAIIQCDVDVSGTNPRAIRFFMSDIEVEVDEGVSVVIGNDFEVPKRKRQRRKAPQPLPQPEPEPSIAPISNFKLVINLHIIGATTKGDQLTKLRKGITIEIEDAGFYIENVDLDDARNNTERPYISARTAHGLVINYLGQKAASILLKVASGVDPNLSLTLTNASNPEFLV